ncbi:MAG: TonB-dependent receptor [Bacteroidales bacterium]|nr:TonB-dependent receptor [Bacteroidales bacterium]
MLKSKYSLLLLSIIVSITTFAQQSPIKGTVIDKSKNAPLPFATVVLSSDSASKDIAGFALTDNDGKFELKPTKKVTQMWLTVRSMGYATQTQSIDNTAKMLHIDMEVDEVSLSEVTVKSNMTGITLRNDTVVFNPKTFTNGGEQNLEDVIKKMPGMTVDEGGNVAYQGKKVDKMLVDGKDVLAGSSGVATRTLPPEFVQSLEVINNYSDGDIADSFSQKEKLALNIKTDGASQWNGTIEAGAGLKNKYNAKVSMLRLDSELSLSLIGSANNTNEPIFSAIDYINTIGAVNDISTSSGASTLELDASEQQLLVQPSNVYKRSAGIVNANVTLTPSARYKMRINTLGNLVGARNSSENEQIYHLTDYDFANSEQSSGKMDNRFASAIIDNKWRLGERTDLRTLTRLNWGDTKSLSTENNTYNTTDTYADDELKTNSRSISHQMAVNSLVGKNLIFGGITIDGKNSFSDYVAETNATLPTEYSIDGCFASEQKQRSVACAANVGMSIPISINSINIKTEISGWSVCSHLTTNNNDEQQASNSASIYVGITKNKGFLRFDVGASATAKEVKAELQNGDKTQSAWHIEPTASMSLNFSQRNKLSLSAKQTFAPTSITKLSEVESLKSYTSVQLASECNTLIEKRVIASLSYQVFSLFSRTTLFMYANYIRTDYTPTTDYYTADLTTYSKYVDGGQTQSLSTMFYFNQGLFSIPLYLRTSASYDKMQSRSQRQSILVDANTDALSSKLGFYTQFSSLPINFDLGGVYRINHSEIDDLNIETIGKTYGANLQVSFSRKSFSASVTGRAERNDNEVYSFINNDVDLAITYKIGRAKIKLIGNNVGHLDSKKWLAESVTPTIESRMRYQQHAGYLLLSAAWSV